MQRVGWTERDGGGDKEKHRDIETGIKRDTHTERRGDGDIGTQVYSETGREGFRETDFIFFASINNF